MNIDDILTPPVLRRVRYFGSPNGQLAMVVAYRASWVFMQKIIKSYGEPGGFGFEVETLRHPKEGQLALRTAGGPLLKYELIWERPARPGEGEGPECEPHRPAGNGRPAGPF